MKKAIVLQQIAFSNKELYGLDIDGKVWHYIPQNVQSRKFAFWTRLTDYGIDGTKKEVNDELTRADKFVTKDQPSE